VIPHPEQSLLFSHSLLHWVCSCLSPAAASPLKQAADAPALCSPARLPSRTHRKGLSTGTRAPQEGHATLLGWPILLSLWLQTFLAFISCCPAAFWSWALRQPHVPPRSCTATPLHSSHPWATGRALPLSLLPKPIDGF